MLKTVLTVDDEVAILKCWTRTLTQEGYRVVQCADAHSALRVLETLRVDAVVAGYRMPAMNGAELLDRARQLQPDARRILLSGAPETVCLEVDSDTAVLSKPWTAQALIDAVAGEGVDAPVLALAA